MYELLTVLLNENRPVTAKEIKKRIGLADVTVRKYVNALRVLGYPVCSSSRGYYLSWDKDEILKTIHGLENRVASMTTAINGLKLILNK